MPRKIKKKKKIHAGNPINGCGDGWVAKGKEDGFPVTVKLGDNGREDGKAKIALGEFMNLRTLWNSQ